MELMITPVIIGDRGMALPVSTPIISLILFLPLFFFPLFKTKAWIISPDLIPECGGRMETVEMNGKYMKVEVPSSETESITLRPGGLTRQGSLAKSNCLCSPTTHAGSFRCRLHRAPTLQRTKSIDSSSKAAESN